MECAKHYGCMHSGRIGAFIAFDGLRAGQGRRGWAGMHPPLTSLHTSPHTSPLHISLTQAQELQDSH